MWGRRGRCWFPALLWYTVSWLLLLLFKTNRWTKPMTNMSASHAMQWPSCSPLCLQAKRLYKHAIVKFQLYKPSALRRDELKKSVCDCSSLVVSHLLMGPFPVISVTVLPLLFVYLFWHGIRIKKKINKSLNTRFLISAIENFSLPILISIWQAMAKWIIFQSISEQSID